jgi:3-phenylpropionate/cinnamic acid dioxygenase small subunit
MTAEQIERACTSFLFHEAELLDRRKFGDWLNLLSPEIEYRVPVRTTRSSGDGEGFSETAFFLNEDYGSLKLRIARLGSEYAWSENPPTRTRRMVSNARVAENGGTPDHTVTSNFVVYCYRGDSATPRLLTGERQDRLRSENGQLKLCRRLVLLDTTVLGMDSLSILL